MWLNKNGPVRLMYLNAWFPVELLGRIRRFVLVLLEVSFEVFVGKECGCILPLYYIFAGGCNEVF